MTTLLQQSTTTVAQVATQMTPVTSNFPSGAVASAPVALTAASVRVRFDTGYATVPLIIARLASATVLSFEVNGQMVRVWDMGIAGYGIQVKSASTAGVWHHVTARGSCTCTARFYGHRCSHVWPVRDAETVFLAWQYAQRCATWRAKEVA